MSEPFIGEIRPFPYNFTPYGWAECDGTLLSRDRYQALYTVIGTTYGGNGQPYFALPDLRCQVPVGMGTGRGLSPYPIGQHGGAMTVTLAPNQHVGPHTHNLQADDEIATTGVPGATMLLGRGQDAGPPAEKLYAYTTAAPNVTLSGDALTSVGLAQPHNNVMPCLALNFCIALQGVYPQRSEP